MKRGLFFSVKRMTVDSGFAEAKRHQQDNNFKQLPEGTW